jgi:hypothetical protein
MFKKLVITTIIAAMASTAMARDITVTFADGSQHQYNNAPDSATPEQIIARARQDFPDRALSNIDGNTTSDTDSIWPTVGKIVLGVIVIGAAVYGIRAIGSLHAHPCVNPTDRASNGSLCGLRASSVRVGGA